MTKNEAHERFIRWIEAHPSDDWRIYGGDFWWHKIYSATAMNNNGVIHTFNQKYEEKND